MWPNVYLFNFFGATFENHQVPGTDGLNGRPGPPGAEGRDGKDGRDGDQGSVGTRGFVSVLVACTLVRAVSCYVLLAVYVLCTHP